MHITFLGGVGTVTGSKYLLEHGGRRLLVDCGLFQGLKNLRVKNWDEFPVDPATIHAVVLTHAHIDHSGFLPRLAKLGFRGKVHCTAATQDLCGLLLPDSGHLQEEEADYLNRHGIGKHHPALALYTEKEARRALEHFHPHGYSEPFEPISGVRVGFSPAGHILGAASVAVRWDGGSILFSGDLGRSDDFLMRPPAAPEAADYVVIESTYGDRLHEKADVLAQLAEVVSRTAARGGSVVVPAFAVGRAQALLYLLSQLKKTHRIPAVPVFLDSPMAADVTGIYHRHRTEHRLDEHQCHDMCHAARIVNTVEESKRLSMQRFPSVIVSASGMATGGRVVHHLKAYAPDPRNTILFAGYQAAGTRGAALVGGARSVKIHGQYVEVRAEVVNLGSFSAHADRGELLEWIGRLPRAPRRVFATHGEPVAADSLRQAIEEKYGWSCTVPDYLGRQELG
jgi:metallo-beta-lactamase family protein